MNQLVASQTAVAVNSNDKWYTLTDSSERLGVPLNTLRHWIEQGRIEPPEKRGPRGAFLYSEQRLERIAARVHHAGRKARLQDRDRYTLGGAAERMGIGMDTLLMWRRLGLIPEPDQITRGGTLCTYSAEVVDRLVSQVPEIRNRQEIAGRRKQAESLKKTLRPADGRYSLSRIAELANIAITTLWHYRKLGLIPQPDQRGPGSTGTYSEQAKSDILAKIPQIVVENRAKTWLTSEQSKARWQDPEYREKVRMGNADPRVRGQRSESARALWRNPDYRKKTRISERLRQRWNKHKQIEDAWKLSTEPKRRGRTKGKVAKHTPVRINRIAYCKLAGMSDYQIAKSWNRLFTDDWAAPTTIHSSIAEHGDAIDDRETYLSRLSASEREAASGLSQSQRKVIADMASKRKSANRKVGA
jgi:DNA-binding transcriptional MerR regulator